MDEMYITTVKTEEPTLKMEDPVTQRNSLPLNVLWPFGESRFFLITCPCPSDYNNSTSSLQQFFCTLKLSAKEPKHPVWKLSRHCSS